MKESATEIQKHKTGAREIKDQENSRGALSVWSPSLPMTLPSSPWWRGSSPPLDYGFVAVSICISLLFFFVLAPYELHNMIMAIFVSLLWWIFLWVIYVTRVKSANVLDEGIWIGGRGCRMNSKVKISQTRRILRISMVLNLAQSQSIPGWPLLAPIYRWPGLKEPIGFNTNYSVCIRYQLIFWLCLWLGLS
jgi:hypothetical protein